MQSYQNVSNSQLWQRWDKFYWRCKRLCKVIKMLAIHNCFISFANTVFVANAYAKLSKCQQFTTGNDKGLFIFLLQTLMQSYQNVSNSQQNRINTTIKHSCKRLCKVIKMLAIHNHILRIITHTLVANAYAKLSKCQQFTTKQVHITFAKKLQTLMQSYQNVSNSQPRVGEPRAGACCKRLCKVIKMLAIHNF